MDGLVHNVMHMHLNDVRDDVTVDSIYLPDRETKVSMSLWWVSDCDVNRWRLAMTSRRTRLGVCSLTESCVSFVSSSAFSLRFLSLLIRFQYISILLMNVFWFSGCTRWSNRGSVVPRWQRCAASIIHWTRRTWCTPFFVLVLICYSEFKKGLGVND